MSDTIHFAATPSQQQLHQHHMQQALHHQQQQQQQQHPDQAGEGSTPPVPQIRIASGHRSSRASATPLPQLRNPPEPYVHEFQPKTPERGGNAAGGDGGTDASQFVEGAGQFHQGQGLAGSDSMQFHHTPSGPFTQGPFTPRGHTYLDPNMQHIIQDPALMQQQQLQQQLLQQQQMFNPLPAMLTPTHGMALPPRVAAFGGAAAAAGRGRGRSAAAAAAAAWLQDPMHNILEEEKERKREMKLLKNREAAREGREKKRRYQMLLEARVSILETQNRALIEELKALKFLFCKPSSAMQQPNQQQQSQQQLQYETQQVVL